MKKIFQSILCLLGFMLIFGSTAYCQNYNLTDPVPFDAKVKTGVLPNGMHYYIRANKFPEKRGEFYIAHNVGAILEDDDQNGLAHFTEHMAFNGTENFPHKTMLNYLETIGVKFGTNVNAGTGVEQTVYNLSNVPLTREGIIDTCLLILHDWSHFISFDDKEVDDERGVIREEWRTYGSAGERMNIKLMPYIYKDSKYAKRDVIGDTAVINHFKHETIKKFYNKWYRTDLQAIVVVGDFDENVMEAKIKKLFSPIPKVENPVQKEVYPVADNKEPLIGVATDKEATGTMVTVYYKHDNIKNEDKNIGYMRLQLVRSLISTMFGNRMSELSRKENAPFLGAFAYYSSFTRSKDAYIGMAQCANNGSLKALTALLNEMQRVKQFGFTASEIDRAKADVLRNYESRFTDRDKRKNRELVYSNVQHFLVNNPNPGIEFEYPFAQKMIPAISLDEINGELKKYITDENMVVTVTAPEKDGVTVPKESEILDVINSIKTLKIEAYVDATAGKKLMDKMPKAGKISKVSTNKIFGTTEWTLSNGMKVIFKPTDIKEDELIIRGYSDGGISQLKDDQVVSANFFGSAISQMGVSEFSLTDLNKMMAGKRVNVSMGLSEEQQNVNGRTSPKDIETALQLINLYFTAPRWNEPDFKSFFEKIKAYYINADADPRKAFADTVNAMESNHHKREMPITNKMLDQVSFEKIKAIYQDRFANPGGFTFQFVGKINPDEVKPLIETYLASLPNSNRKESYKDNGIRYPKGKLNNDFKHENKTPRTSVHIVYKGDCKYNADNRLLGAALRHILELRYTETIREEEGGAYGVRVTFSLMKEPVQSFDLTIGFDTDPAKADKMKEIVYKEIKKLLESGPTEVDLQKAKEYFLKQRSEDMKENQWWLSILNEYYTNNLDYMSNYETNVKALTLKSVQDFAKKTLSQGNIIDIVMRP